MSSFNFLLVDDEEAFVEALARRLRKRGFKAECVFSGAEAAASNGNSQDYRGRSG